MNHSGSPGLRAVDIWDVLVASIIKPASIGDALAEYTAAKAAFLDASIAAIPLTAMRGTDSALTAHQFTMYSYDALLANNASYAPPNKTVISLATLSAILLAGEMSVQTESAGTTPAAETNTGVDGKNFEAMTGFWICDGSYAAFRNMEGAQRTLTLVGWTMA